ncbi:HD domain-containing protein [Candidatus Woesearchaeota archaeon]|jgi:(p)ppGpp synthase/HD superfamily hydrolase|nr:HD domain-containing protein [Candidatus Woesearchaeota archaeon]
MELWQKIEKGLSLINEIFEKTNEDNYKVLMPEITNIIIGQDYEQVFSETQEDFFKKGLEYAIKKHLGDYRDNGLPYAVHPVSTAYLLATWNRPLYLVVSGLLHDVPEHQGIDELNNINSRFKEKVSEIIDSVSIF